MELEEIRKGLQKFEIVRWRGQLDDVSIWVQKQIEELKAENNYNKNLADKLNKLHDKAVNECTDLKIEKHKLKEREKKLEKLVKNLCFDNGNYTSKEVEQLLKD